MESKILFNIASRSRPEKFYQLLVNLIDMVKSTNYEIVCKIDIDDPCYRSYESAANGHTKEINWKFVRVRTAEGVSSGKIHAINRDIPADGWDILVDVSDDFVFTRKGLDNIIRQHCGPDDCVHFPEPFATKQNERNKNENIIIMACMGREYYNRFGYIYNPVYKSLFCDNELTAVAKKLGRYKFVNEEIFYHAHPAAGYGTPDAQTKHTESFWNEDKTTYNKRKALNFPI